MGGTDSRGRGDLGSFTCESWRRRVPSPTAQFPHVMLTAKKCGVRSTAHRKWNPYATSPTLGSTMSDTQDDKGQYCIPFILERLTLHHQQHKGLANAPPFFLGLNGVQGAGKTVLVSIIKSTLQGAPHNLPTAVFSLDDFYLTHTDQAALAKSHPHNPLLQHRGQPSTHDVALALSVFESLKENKETKIPSYDKSAFEGQGDREPEGEWESVNAAGKPIMKVVLFEGWCVGFRPVSDSTLKQAWEHAVAAKEKGGYNGRLGHNSLQSVTDINEALKKYDQITDQLDAFIHIDAADPQFVYEWRQEQEVGLRKSKGRAMTHQQVRHFVDGYYPAYELFTGTLRTGVFREENGKQLRLVVGENRKVQKVETI